MTSANWFPVPEGQLTGLFKPFLRAVRVEFNGETVAESSDVMVLRDGRLTGEIHYLFSTDEVTPGVLVETGHVEDTEKGEVEYFDVAVGDERAEDAAFAYPNEPIEGRPDLRGYVGFEWDAMDAWYEEAEQVYKHPRDPYHRIDTVESDRHVRVEVEGVTVAESTRTVFQFETGLPRRFYFPREDVDMDRFTRTDATWRCPYKGLAEFWSIEVDGEHHENLAWAYPDPDKDAAEVAGMLCFYNEELDIYLDGELEGKPQTRYGAHSATEGEPVADVGS